MDVTNDYVEEDSKHIQTMIKTAIEERNEAILSLACGKCTDSSLMKNLLVFWRDNEGNTILHLAAKIAPPVILNSIPGGAFFQMRQDLKWFKKVESIMRWRDRLIINRNQETARDIFMREHKGLIEEAEKHMHSTASSLMLAAFLIYVPMYAAVLPRAYNSSTNVFVILALYLAANLSLISATVFIVIILTSCYGEENFLTSLPQNLVIGIATLIFSLAMIMAACVAELYSRGNQIGGIVLTFAFILVLVLAFSQVKFLLTGMFSSTYGRSGSGERDNLLRVARKNYYEVRCPY